MNRLVALFQKGFMKLTGGKMITVLANDEFVMTRDEFETFILDFSKRRNEKVVQRLKVLEGQFEELKESTLNAYQNGYKDGVKKGSKYTLLLPSVLPDDEELVGLVSNIASELLDQGDVKSCSWLFKKIHQCRSL